jgi:alkylation response protein AidB-like acyl-CoA dehydrogenase
VKSGAPNKSEYKSEARLIPTADTAVLRAQLALASGMERLRELLSAQAPDPDLLGAVLDEAARFSDRWLVPFNRAADKAGCRIEGGRVATAPGHLQAWEAYREGGWIGLDQPAAFGGQELPLFMLAACQEIFDRGSVAFGMLPTSLRGAARLIAAHADDELKAEWLPRLVTGDWGATICISEPEAGSDVGRIRTLAEPTGDGGWSITGEKIWISYGDHDLAPRIGHCVLARTPGAAAGGAGLSLFLVPDRLGDGAPNGISVRRIEEKLGLHGSPTCALGFEGACGRMIGQSGRGLAQLFTMITTMRLMVAVQGVAIGSAAADTALAYARERRQGGPAERAPVPIAEHADVQRLLAGMASRVEVVRALVLACAVHADIARIAADEAEREQSQALVGWLLPILKTFAGETGFEVASEAIQVFGGAGYVKDWPVEQLLRDARVLTIFEGTSGMQSLDLLQRRLRRDRGRGLEAFLELARRDIAVAPASPETQALSQTLDELADEARRLAQTNSDAGAYPFLRLAAWAATGWAALRLAECEGADAAGRRLRGAGRGWLASLPARARLERELIAAAEAGQDGFVLS